MSSAFNYTKANAQPVDADNVVISLHNNQHQLSSTNIQRRVSASRLVKDADGSVKVERKNTDLGIAIQRRISAGSLPSIIPIAPLPEAEPMLG